MFDSLLAAVAAARTPGDGVRACAQLENAACAARLGHMADMLAAVLAEDGSADRELWCFDNWAAVCAQIGAAHAVTSGVANTLLTDAVTLRDRLPKVAALFATGALTYRQVHQICLRTLLVQDPDALEAIDTALVEMFATSGVMSVDALAKAIDAVVLIHDPYAVRRTQEKSRGHYVDVRVDDASGSGQLEASMSITDLTAVDKRADALARTVCERDPRTKDELRAAALGAMGFGWDRLPCLCESQDCDAATTPPVGGIVVHVIGRHDTLDTPTTGPDNGPNDDDDSDDGASGSGAGPDAGLDPDDRPGDGGPRPADDENESDSVPAEIATDDATPDPQPADEPPAAAPIGDPTSQRRRLVGGSKDVVPKPCYSYILSRLIAALNTVTKGPAPPSHTAGMVMPRQGEQRYPTSIASKTRVADYLRSRASPRSCSD